MVSKAEKVIDRNIARMEQTDGLAIGWVRSLADLGRAGAQGLFELYADVFADPPYNEQFSAAEVHEIFADMLDQNGLIFTSALKSNPNQVVAFAASTPISAAADVAACTRDVLGADQNAYFAEDGVAKPWRRRGISARMKALLLAANWACGMRGVLLRTTVRNYPQINAVSKSGGRVIADLTQDVPSPRQDGTVATDTRAFYLYTPEGSARPVQLGRVCICQEAAGDCAYVQENISAALHLRLTQTYPGLTAVRFGAPVGETIFDAPLYLPDRVLSKEALTRQR